MDDLIRLIDVLSGVLKVLNDAKEGAFTSKTRQLIYNHINEATEAILVPHRPSITISDTSTALVVSKK